MNRQFSKVELRDLGGFASAENFDLNFSKDFMWNRNFSINWDLTRTLRFSLQTAMNANIEEPYYTPEFGREHYDMWRDSVYRYPQTGNPYTYNQVFTASGLFRSIKYLCSTGLQPMCRTTRTTAGTGLLLSMVKM
jgi:cell surface protein SprA